MPAMNDRANFIEESGLFFESMGLTRMSGRILGYLMVTDKEKVSFEEFTQVLQASKSSISTNLKALTGVMFIKTVTIPGDRKTYYELSPDICWSDILKKRTHDLKVMITLFKKGYHLRSNTKDQPSQWIENAISFYEWLLQEMGNLIEKWEKTIEKDKNKN